jgi:hypothetical protein
MKYVIAFPVIVGNVDCERDGDGNPSLYNSHEEATREVFLDCLDWLLNRSHEEREEIGVYHDTIATMLAMESGATPEQMEEFLNSHPHTNDHDLFVMPLETFNQQRNER